MAEAATRSCLCGDAASVAVFVLSQLCVDEALQKCLDLGDLPLHLLGAGLKAPGRRLGCGSPGCHLGLPLARSSKVNASPGPSRIRQGPRPALGR